MGLFLWVSLSSSEFFRWGWHTWWLKPAWSISAFPIVMLLFIPVFIPEVPCVRNVLNFLTAKLCLKLNSNLSLPAPYKKKKKNLKNHWFHSLANKRCFSESEFSLHVRISLCSEQPKEMDTKLISLQYVDECMASETLSLFARLIICFWSEEERWHAPLRARVFLSREIRFNVWCGLDPKHWIVWHILCYCTSCE